MPNNWRRTTLGEAATWLSGGTPRKSREDYWGGEIPWISGKTLVSGLVGTSERRLTELGAREGSRIAPQGATLLLVRGMSLLQEVRVGRTGRPVAFNQDVKALVPNEEFDESYFTYSIEALRPQLLRLVHRASHGTGVLETGAVKSTTIPVPALSEQRRIAGVLGALDDLIATGEALVGQLRELALVRVQEAQSDDSSDLPLADVCVFENRKRVPLSAAQRREMPGDYPYYGAAAQMDSVGEYLFDQPRVLVGEDGTVTTTSGNAVVQYVWGRYWVNNHAHVLVGTSISTELLRVLLTNADVRDRVTGAVQPKLNMGNLKSLRLRVPSDPDVDQFARILTAFERELFEEARQLQRTRDELLPLLMSGRVRVKAEDPAAAESAIQERTRVGGC